MNYEINAQAPCRISFAGGGTDIESYEHTGEVVSATIGIYQKAILRVGKSHTSQRVSTNTRKCGLPIAEFPLVEACVERAWKSTSGFHIKLYSSVPMRSGLGGSAAMCCAILKAMYDAQGIPKRRREIAEEAYRIETCALKNSGGRQDQYAAVFGGINLFTF